jgi:hypothetical protein
MITLRDIKKLHNFKPKHTFSQLQQNLPQSFDSIVQDSRLYKAVKTLTKKARPTEENNYEKRWHDFYLPLKRKGYFILVPMAIIMYDKRFFLGFLHSNIEVRNGRAKSNFYLSLIRQTLKFSQILKKDPAIVMQSIPYDIRTGRVLGKYVLKNLLPYEKKEEILKLYRDHIERGEKSHDVSLNDYLTTAALCYKASFGNKTNGLTVEQMYRKWANGRDCGMLGIKNKKSRKDFSHWLDNKSNCGGHPFEIVFSWHGHGIHLFPPYMEKPYFTLSVTNYMYAMPFIEMVKTLTRNRIPFKAHELERVLDYLSGESYFTVNAYAEHYIFYDMGDRKLSKHIEWDEPKILKWK